MALTGRPRKFSEESALDAAMMVFWQEGYHASSVAQLCSAMQLKAPSLYATFGDKESLFLKSLDRYFEVYGAGPRAALQHPDLGMAIAGFFAAVVKNITSHSTPKGCLAANVMVGAANESAAIAHKLNSWLAMTDNLIEQRLSLAKNAGEIVPDVDVLRLARVTNSLRHGLSIRARAGESREQLRQAASDAAATILGAMNAAHSTPSLN